MLARTSSALGCSTSDLSHLRHSKKWDHAPSAIAWLISKLIVSIATAIVTTWADRSISKPDLGRRSGREWKERRNYIESALLEWLWFDFNTSAKSTSVSPSFCFRSKLAVSVAMYLSDLQNKYTQVRIWPRNNAKFGWASWLWQPGIHTLDPWRQTGPSRNARPALIKTQKYCRICSCLIVFRLLGSSETIPRSTRTCGPSAEVPVPGTTTQAARDWNPIFQP